MDDFNDVRDAVAKAYRAGAEDVHDAWVKCGGNSPGDPDFWEAAGDYADSAAQPIMDALLADRDALAADVARLREALDWAIAEIDGRTIYRENDAYSADEQRQNAFDCAAAALKETAR